VAAEALGRVYPSLTCPAGAFYYFVRISGSSERFAAALLDECRVAVVPGVAFGTEGWVRASFAGEDGDVHTGFHRLAEFLSRVVPSEERDLL
jgi:aspartate/methionine/tyrosine aminotransferase